MKSDINEIYADISYCISHTSRYLTLTFITSIIIVNEKHGKLKNSQLLQRLNVASNEFSFEVLVLATRAEIKSATAE